MTNAELQKRAQELADFPVGDESAWVERVKSESAEVVAGAILKWHASGGLSTGTDHKASRREAAQALLEARFTEDITSTLNKLDASARFVAWVGVAVGIVGCVVAFF